VPVDREYSGAAKSPEALTLLQLFQGIDMAGFLLPPDVLDVRYAEDRDLSVHYSGANHSYATASSWLRARCSEQLPRVQLLQVAARQAMESATTAEPAFDLVCARVAGDSLSSVVVRCPSAFEAVALALRHKVDINLDAFGDACLFPDTELPSRFPLWRSEADAAEQDARIKSSIKSTIESTRLESALKIARGKGDKAAELKIRAALRILDERAAANLPVVSEGGDDGPFTKSAAAAAAAAAVADAADKYLDAEGDLINRILPPESNSDDDEN
jgi:hypothetical protein